MQPVNLFDLASQQARWLSVRQSAVAGNVANANTPGYHAREVEPFESVLSNTRVSMAATHADHLKGGQATQASFSIKETEPPETELPSKNTVVLENEMMKAGEVRRSYELNTAIVKAFHRMLMMTSKA
jgi:flagellar basal-body rod protein FlgB